jgi:hypothetical protein
MASIDYIGIRPINAKHLGIQTNVIIGRNIWITQDWARITLGSQEWCAALRILLWFYHFMTISSQFFE